MPIFILVEKEVHLVWIKSTLIISFPARTINKTSLNNLSKKLASGTFSMKLASFLPSTSLLTIYRSLIESRLRYCDVVRDSSSNSLKDKVQWQQDRAIHFVTEQCFKDNTEQASFCIFYTDPRDNRLYA